MNIVTRIEYDIPFDDPRDWHRCEIEHHPVHRVRYETDFDLTTLLRNFAVAGVLQLAWNAGYMTRSTELLRP